MSSVKSAVLVVLIAFGQGFGASRIVAAEKVAGEALSTEELRELQVNLNKRQNLRVSFTQSRVSALRPKKPAKSSGNAIFAKPAKFRWELVKPESDILLYDGQNLVSYKPGQKTATRFKTEGDRAREIKEVIDFVLDFDALMKRYNLIESLRRERFIELKLRPKELSAISDLSIVIDDKDFFVRTVKMIFQNKNSSEFEFTDPVSGKIEEHSFKVPQGVSVVDGN